jgi:enoyl-CoA hydratase/carnithine racemase
MTDSSSVIREKRGQAFWITINRPDKRNAINADVVAGIAKGYRDAHDDKEVRVIVLTGAGDKAFCAGADLQNSGAAFAMDFSRPNVDYADLLRLSQNATKPAIARVGGVCMAGGMGLLCMTDMAVAADHVIFGLPEVKVGVFPMQVMSLLQSMAPPRLINEWALTGEPFDAKSAQAAGLLNYVVPSAELDAKVDWLVCREICIPASADFQLSMPVANQSGPKDPRWAPIFAASRSRIPAPLGNWQANAYREGNDFVIRLSTEPNGRAIDRLEFFPDREGVIANAGEQKLRRSANGYDLRIAVAPQPIGDGTALAGVLVLGAASSDAQPVVRSILLLQSIDRGQLANDQFHVNFRVELDQRAGTPVNVVQIMVGPIGFVAASEQAVVDYIRSIFVDHRDPDLTVSIGGPYRVAVRAIGFGPATRTGVMLTIGQRYTADFLLEPAVPSPTVAS